MGGIRLVIHMADPSMGGGRWQNDASRAADTHAGTWDSALSRRSVTLQAQSLKSEWVTTGGRSREGQRGTVSLQVERKTGCEEETSVQLG